MQRSTYIVFQTHFIDKLNQFIKDDKDEKGGKWIFFFDDFEFLGDNVNFVGTIDDKEMGEGEEEDLGTIASVHDTLGSTDSKGTVIFEFRDHLTQESDETVELLDNIIKQLNNYGYCKISKTYDFKEKYMGPYHNILHIKPKTKAVI